LRVRRSSRGGRSFFLERAPFGDSPFPTPRGEMIPSVHWMLGPVRFFAASFDISLFFPIFEACPSCKGHFGMPSFPRTDLGEQGTPSCCSSFSKGRPPSRVSPFSFSSRDPSSEATSASPPLSVTVCSMPGFLSDCFLPKRSGFHPTACRFLTDLRLTPLVWPVPGKEAFLENP